MEIEFKIPDSEVRIRLCRRDCVEGMRALLEPGSVDVVVTSPPYNLGIPYKGYDDSISRQDYLEWLDRWAVAVGEVLAEQGSLFLNIGAKPSDPTVPYQVLQVMQRHFVVQNVIHWIKSIAISKADVGDYPGICDDVVVGHYKPINSRRYLNDCHEYIFHLTKRGDVPIERLAIGVPYQDRTNMARWRQGGSGLHCRGNTWFIPYPTIRSRDHQRPHPATFPPKLPEMCIRLHGLRKTRRVLDPFMGIGSTALACMALAREFVGFELSEAYFAEAERLVRSALGSSEDAEEGPERSPGRP